MKSYTYNDISEYNKKYISPTGEDVSPNSDYDKNELLWEFCAVNNDRNIAVLNEYNISYSDDDKCHTVAFCEIYELVQSLPNEDIVTLSLMGFSYE